jgi:hypothetical protein
MLVVRFLGAAFDESLTRWSDRDAERSYVSQARSRSRRDRNDVTISKKLEA